MLSKLLNSRFIFLLLSVLILVMPSIVNGFPVLYSDSSTYIESGFQLETPFDRPITYGLLLRFMSLNGLTIFLVPVMHALLCIYVLLRLLSVLDMGGRGYLNVFLLTLFISLFTTYTWSLNLVLPDFLTPLGFILLFGLLYEEQPPRKRLFDYFLFFLCAASHISNLPLYVLLLLCFLFLRKAIKLPGSAAVLRSKFFVLGSLLGLSYLIMGSAISKSKAVFFAGNLVQKGIIQEHLSNVCEDTDYKMCAYKDSLPRSFEYFVWNEKSPLYQLGGWRDMRAELSLINSNCMRDPQLLKLQIAESFSLAKKQLIMFEVGEGNGPFETETVLGQRIKKYFMWDHLANDSSQQSRGKLIELNLLNSYYYFTGLTICVVFISAIILMFFRSTIQIKMFSLSAVLLIFSNAALVAFSSEISHRHGCKLYWLILLVIFLMTIGSRSVARAA